MIQFKHMYNHKGFGAIGMLAIIVIIGLIGVTGWLVYDRQNNKLGKEKADTNQAQNTTDVQKVTEPKKVVDETEKWTTFTPDSKLYTIKLPDGWTFVHQNDDCDCLFSGTMNFNSGSSATIETAQGGRDGVVGFMIFTDSKDDSGERFSRFQKLGTFKSDTLEGTKYYFEQKEATEGIGLDKGGKEYAYYFVKDGKGIYIAYSINPGSVNQLELVEKSIKTLR